ncbi:unnamed protein product, partial [Adineta steineri]
SSTNSSLTISSSQTRCVPFETRSSSTKSMTKSRSTHNLNLPITTTTNNPPTCNTQQSKVLPARRGKTPVSRRPPNLPTATNIQSSSSSSSTSSNTSSPTKTKQHLSPSLQESIIPLHELDNSSNDLMPKWAQDCFYRTVVLGLKPLLLQDIPSTRIIQRHNKYIRSQTIITTTEPKTAPNKTYMTRKARINRTRSEDRVRGSSLSILNSTGDTTSSSSSSSHSQLPSYAAHTSSSINKLRDNLLSSTSSVPVPLLSSSTNSSLTISSSQTRCVPFETRSSSTKSMTKSRSTHNLNLP